MSNKKTVKIKKTTPVKKRTRKTVTKKVVKKKK